MEIFFIFAQKGQKNNISKIEAQEQKIIVEQITNGINSGYVYTLFKIKIINDIKEKEEKIITLTIEDNQGELYVSNIDLNNPEPLQYQVIFNSYLNENGDNSLNQIILPFEDQFNIFKNNLKNDKNMVYYLYSSKLTSLLNDKAKADFETFLDFFIEIYQIYNTNQQLKEIIIKFFEKIDLKVITKAKINIQKEYNILLAEEKIRKDLINITDNNELLTEKIDVFLGFYYLFNHPKHFLYFTVIKNEGEKIRSHLIANRTIFKNFSTNIINMQLLDDTENLEQIYSMFCLLPSFVDIFEILSNEFFYMKISGISQIEHKVLDLYRILKPKKDDDIEELYENFQKFYQNFKNEHYMPLYLKREFFFDYCELFEKEDLKKIDLIIKILKKYNENLSVNSKVKIETELNKIYCETGIHLINTQKLLNENLLDFIKNNKNIELFNEPEQIANGIILDEKNKDFVNDFLNNNFYDFDLKEILGQHKYSRLIKTIFDKFILPKDLLAIRYWKIDESYVPSIVLEIFLNTLKRIWLNYPENHMYALEALIGKLFALSSLKVKNYKYTITEIESKISNDKILVVYSKILYYQYNLDYEFKHHIINYIYNHNREGPLAIWYTLNTFEDKYDKFNYLEEHLKEEYSVKVEDFINYPSKIEERITLFTNLFNGDFFDTNLNESIYYRKSIEAKDNLENLKFKDVMIMYQNILNFTTLFIFFFPGKNNEETNFTISMFLIDFSEKCGTAKKHYESLKTVLNYWNRFFPNEKNKERNILKKFINEYENSPLKEFNRLYSESVNYLDNLKEAKEGEQLLESIFFMEIFEEYKNNFEKTEDRNRYNHAYKKFNELIILGNNSDVNYLDFKLKEILVNAVYKNYDKFNDEIEFIKKYFNFNTKNNKDFNNFNTKIFKRTLFNLVKQYQEEHGEYKIKADDIPDVENEDEEENANININQEEEVDEDGGFNLFGPIETEDEENKGKKPENEIKKGQDINLKLIEKKNEMLKEMLFLFKNFFTNANKFIRKKNDLNEMNQKYIDERKEVYKSYIQFFIKILEINHGFAKFSNNEFFEEIIKRAIKIYINGINLGLLDNLENTEYKKELILFSQFLDILKFYIDKRKIQKGILFKIIDGFYEIYQNKNSEEKAIVGMFGKLLTRINDVDFKDNKEKTKNLIIGLFIKEKKMIINEIELNDLMFNDGNANFYYLYNDLIPFINELFKEEIDSKLRFENNNEDQRIVDFNLRILTKINTKITERKELEELILYYFETKIINAFNRKYCNEYEKELYHDIKIRNILRPCLNKLEKDFRNNQVNVSILFCLAFVKCFLNKLINSLYKNHELTGDVSYIFNNIKEKNNEFGQAMQLYVLKLLFDGVDSYYDYIQNENNYEKSFQISYNSNENLKSFKATKSDSSEKNFGFDYLFIPTKEENYEDFNFMLNKLKEIKKNNINDDIDDKELVKKINENQNLDIFYCALLNIHFSFLYRKNYINSDELSIINKWVSNKINKQEIEIFKENELVKKVFIFLNKKIFQNELNSNILSHNKLLCQLLSARFVLCTLSSKDNNLLFYKLITNIKSIIDDFPNFYEYYLKDFDIFIKDKKDMSYLTYKIINYIILSHLYFGFILEKITFDDIKHFIALEEKQDINANYLLDILSKEFDFIQKRLLNLIGIRKTIIFMNKIYDDVSPIIRYLESKNDSLNNLEENIDSKISQTITNFKECVEEYYQLCEKIDIEKEEKEELSSTFTHIIYEDNEFFNNKKDKPNSICPYITYLTSTNFCTYDDFKDQFFYFCNENYPLIKCILNNDNILEIIKCISPLNDFINSVYNELALKISIDDINKKIRDVLNQRTLDKIEIFNNNLEKIGNILKIQDIKKIDRNTSLISDVINIKDNNINRIYTEIISKYNKFLSRINIYKNNQEALEPIIIQSALESQYISFVSNCNSMENSMAENRNNNDNSISIKDRLIELIQIYSKRDRFITKENLINVYDGGKITYDYELIENKLEKEFILGKRLFSTTQKMFIFSNEVFSGERNNIFLEIIQNYPQTEIQEELFKKVNEYIESLGKNDLIEIYHALQYIIINKKYIDYDQEQTNLNYIIKLINKENYFMNEPFNNLLNSYGDMFSLNNIIFLYENFETKVFEYLTENIKNNLNKKENQINKVLKDKIKEILNDQNMPINQENFINSIKKYILRYCIGYNSGKNNILKNFENIDFILNKYDIWGKKLLSDEKFGENCKKINEINNEGNCIIKYSLNILFNNNELDFEEDKKEKQNDFDKHKIEEDEEKIINKKDEMKNKKEEEEDSDYDDEDNNKMKKTRRNLFKRKKKNDDDDDDD